jgi:hypothetical protein
MNGTGGGGSADTGPISLTPVPLSMTMTSLLLDPAPPAPDMTRVVVYRDEEAACRGIARRNRDGASGMSNNSDSARGATTGNPKNVCARHQCIGAKRGANGGRAATQEVFSSHRLGRIPPHRGFDAPGLTTPNGAIEIGDRGRFAHRATGRPWHDLDAESVVVVTWVSVGGGGAGCACVLAMRRPFTASRGARYPGHGDLLVRMRPCAVRTHPLCCVQLVPCVSTPRQQRRQRVETNHSTG